MRLPVFSVINVLWFVRMLLFVPKCMIKNLVKDAPSTFKYAKARGKEYDENMVYTLQVAPEDCTGCALCVEVCPAKNKQETRLKAINMASQPPLRE